MEGDEEGAVDSDPSSRNPRQQRIKLNEGVFRHINSPSLLLPAQLLSGLPHFLSLILLKTSSPLSPQLLLSLPLPCLRSTASTSTSSSVVVVDDREREEKSDRGEADNRIRFEARYSSESVPSEGDCRIGDTVSRSIHDLLDRLDETVPSDDALPDLPDPELKPEPAPDADADADADLEAEPKLDPFLFIFPPLFTGVVPCALILSTIALKCSLVYVSYVL